MTIWAPTLGGTVGERSSNRSAIHTRTYYSRSAAVNFTANVSMPILVANSRIARISGLHTAVSDLCPQGYQQKLGLCCSAITVQGATLVRNFWKPLVIGFWQQQASRGYPKRFGLC